MVDLPECLPAPARERSIFGAGVGGWIYWLAWMMSANWLADAAPVPGEQVLVGVHREAWVGVAAAL